MPVFHRERHRTQHIGWLRAAVLGANYGIVSTASLVVGVAASNATHTVGDKATRVRLRKMKFLVRVCWCDFVDRSSFLSQTNDPQYHTNLHE